MLHTGTSNLLLACGSAEFFVCASTVMSETKARMHDAKIMFFTRLVSCTLYSCRNYDVEREYRIDE